ncbi:MAG: hypothetical protein RI894_1342 [Bacteroidota bacterium]
MAIAACKPSTPSSSTAGESASSESLLTEYPTTNFDTMRVSARLSEESKQFSFKSAESFDRCDAVSVTRRDGKPLTLSAEFKKYLDCIDYNAQLVNDRYMVYSNDKKVSLYDLAKNVSLDLFTPQSYDDANLTNLGWSPDKTRVAFVSTTYTDEAQKKLGYTARTRLIILELNADKTAVAHKTKFDIPIQFIPSEGNYVSNDNCFWANSTTIRYRIFVSEDFEILEKSAKKYTNLAITEGGISQ